MSESAAFMCAMRPARIIADVVVIEDVFDDPDTLLNDITARAPFNLIYGRKGYEKSGGADPWFRENWIRSGEVLVPAAEKYLHNAKLIAAAKKAFNAAIVRPFGFTWNICGPMNVSRPHFDLAPYRGLDGSIPHWLHVVVHNSQLFTAWAVPSTTGLTLFYKGRYGGFEYWPDGPQNPSAQFEPPFWNAALVTDNDFMYHRPMAIGEPEQRFYRGDIGADSKLHRHPDGRRWQVIDETGVRATWEPEMLRFSIVWKAFCFASEKDAEIYDNHTDDLTDELIWQIFADEMRARGSTLFIPTDPLTNREFRAALLAEYPNQGMKYLAGA